MAFWTDSTLEPKRQYRFLIEFGGIVGGATFVAKKVNKPEITVTEAAHKYINHTFYYPGRIEWNTVTMTLVDPVNPDMSQNLTSILEASGYVIPRNPEDITTISKASAVTNLGNVTITQYGDNHPTNYTGTPPLVPNGKLETWILNNAWIKRVKFSDLDYESDELSEIELELRYDWATLETTVGQSTVFAENGLGALGKNGTNRWTNQS